MNYTRIFTVTVAATALCLAATAASAQHRGGGGGRPMGGGGHVVTGRAVPVVRGGGHVVVAPRFFPARVVGYYPYRPYYYPYRAGFTVGFFAGFGYPFGFGGYGYPYRYPYYYPYPYAYPYAYPYPYPYPYAASGYPLPPAGYVSATPGVAYGGVRIEGAPPDAQVFCDGYYMGVVDDFDGPTQHLNLQAGSHRVEIRPQGAQPVAFDVNVQAGQTMSVHADVR